MRTLTPVPTNHIIRLPDQSCGFFADTLHPGGQSIRVPESSMRKLTPREQRAERARARSGAATQSLRTSLMKVTDFFALLTGANPSPPPEAEASSARTDGSEVLMPLFVPVEKLSVLRDHCTLCRTNNVAVRYSTSHVVDEIKVGGEPRTPP